MPMTPIFCFKGSFKFFRAGIGTMRITKSVKICMLALENHRAFMFRQ